MSNSNVNDKYLETVAPDKIPDVVSISNGLCMTVADIRNLCTCVFVA